MMVMIMMIDYMIIIIMDWICVDCVWIGCVGGCGGGGGGCNNNNKIIISLYQKIIITVMGNQIVVAAIRADAAHRRRARSHGGRRTQQHHTAGNGATSHSIAGHFHWTTVVSFAGQKPFGSCSHAGRLSLVHLFVAHSHSGRSRGILGFSLIGFRYNLFRKFVFFLFLNRIIIIKYRWKQKEFLDFLFLQINDDL